MLQAILQGPRLIEFREVAVPEPGKGQVLVELGLVQRREINLIGDMNYTAPDYEDAIRFIAAGRIKTSELVSDYFPLTDYPQAYQYIDEHQDTVMKVLLKVCRIAD